MSLLNTVRVWYQQERRNIHHFQGNLKAMLAWPLIGLALCAAIWGFAISSLDKERDDFSNQISSEATALSALYAKQIGRSLEKMDDLTSYIRFNWETKQGAVDFSAFAANGMFKNSKFVSLLIIDPSGRAITSSPATPSDLRFDDRPYFAYHKANVDRSMRVGTPLIGKISKILSVHLTRRLNTPTGDFAGVLVIGVDFESFLPAASDLAFGRFGFIGLIGDDGSVRSATAAGVSDGSARALLRAVPPRDIGETETTLLGAKWFSDQKPRIVSLTRVANFPYRVIVGLSQAEKMLPFRSITLTYYRAAFLATFVIIFFVLAAMTLSARLVVRKGEEEDMRKAYRGATEGGQEGFFLWRFVRDRNGEVLDFRLVDCNERAASLYGMEKSKLLGARLTHMYPGHYGNALVEIFKAGYDAGFAEADIELPPASLIKAKWIHRKISRTREGVTATIRDTSDLHVKELEMARLATEDALTGLPNRYWLTTSLPTLLEGAAASKSKLALLFIDLDDFKNVNDSLGHSAGDELLKAAALRLKSLLRPSDSVVRLGGDEFTVILNPVMGVEHVAHVASRIVAAFKEPFDLANSRNYVGTSIGISLFPKDAADAEALLKNADIAMYSAKESKGQYRFYENHLYERLRKRIDTESEMQIALTQDQFVVYYQPRTATRTGELVGFEALVRWIHPTKGMVPPIEFIAIAEASDIILKLGEVVMHKVCKQISDWQKQGLKVAPISINVSAKQFDRADVKGLVAHCLKFYELEPHLIEVELTESAMMGEGDDILTELKLIEAMGVKIHVDDFGTGYSSLAQLQRLNVDVLKVDRAFTMKLGESGDGEIFFHAIVSMAHALGMDVIAEGVETAEQLQVLQDLGCDEVQGYYISKPVPAAQVPAIIAKRFLFPADAPSQRGTGSVLGEPFEPAP